MHAWPGRTPPGVRLRHEVGGWAGGSRWTGGKRKREGKRSRPGREREEKETGPGEEVLGRRKERKKRGRERESWADWAEKRKGVKERLFYF